ncbi:MAG: fructose-1,6-bisphosphate aldolase, class II [candidate division Zixibacteria bacterium HGW-Zixibacteria-1]|nr:MAG: fructose-1,6-bisphosphate aldolase, class II [candidate division Zixibacteria bacterium HGW-Zixibacteria-1]
MPLISLIEMYKPANKQRYAIGQFNVNNMEFVQAVMEAAQELKSPAILAASTSALKYGGYDYLIDLVKTGARLVSVPIALHLDHGENIEDAEKCINAGFTSVMIDASHEDFEENIRITKEVVKMAHPKNIAVEAELGRLGGIEDGINVDERDAFLTDPKQAMEFVERTMCDALAVAVGTSHGAYKFKAEAKLAFERIEEIKKKTGIPLVLHGASGVSPALVEKAQKYGAELPGAKGVPDEAYKEAIKLGINKINIDTDLRLGWLGTVRELLATNKKNIDPRKVLGPARDTVKEIIKEKMMLFGSAGKG